MKTNPATKPISARSPRSEIVRSAELGRRIQEKMSPAAGNKAGPYEVSSATGRPFFVTNCTQKRPATAHVSSRPRTPFLEAVCSCPAKKKLTSAEYYPILL